MSHENAPVRWHLNGNEVENEAGMTIMEAAKVHGIEIPCFCYHPGLSIAGNCRICMVESNRSPKPIISCSERIAEGLEIETESEKAVDARNSVMEFQLINHPLDCPVCDKAGECVLQDHSYEHGPDRSRFVEDKNIRHTKELGPTIDIWGNRCIVCTRCIRFCDEISGTGELCVVERGDRSVVDVFPGVPIDNSMAGNTVDICPVGALISSDFKFEARVWNMEKSSSICGGCSRGCNIEVETLDGFVKRMTPRENMDVNEWWICDHGRYGWRHLYADSRLEGAQHCGQPVSPTGTSGALHQILSRGSSIAFLVDPFMTCEELHLVKTLANSTEGTVAGWLPASGNEESFPGGFKISADKFPNRKGAELVLGTDLFTAAADDLKEKLAAGSIDTLIAFVGGHGFEGAGETWNPVISKADSLVVIASQNGSWCEGADLVIPATAPLEKEGVWVNEDDRVQRVRSCRSLTSQHFPSELVLLQEVQIHRDDRKRTLSAAGIFRELSEASEEFAGHSHSTLGESGTPLSQRPAAMSSEGGQ